MSEFTLLLDSSWPKEEGSEVLTCPICRESFSDILHLRDHMQKELGILPECLDFLNIDLGISSEEPSNPELVQCPKCKKICKGLRGFNQHFGKVHGKKKKHSVCKLCGNAFKNKYILRFHVKQVHSQATRVSCHICGEILYNKYMLPKHIRKAHSLQ